MPQPPGVSGIFQFFRIAPLDKSDTALVYFDDDVNLAVAVTLGLLLHPFGEVGQFGGEFDRFHGRPPIAST